MTPKRIPGDGRRHPRPRPGKGPAQHAQYVDCVETADQLRRALRRAHPDGRFSVHANREGTLALLPTIDVSWTGGPDEPTVRELADRFVGYTIVLSDDGDLTPIPVPVPRPGPNGTDMVLYNVISIDLHHD